MIDKQDVTVCLVALWCIGSLNKFPEGCKKLPWDKETQLFSAKSSKNSDQIINMIWILQKILSVNF